MKRLLLTRSCLIFAVILLGCCFVKAQVAPQISGEGAPGNPCFNGGQQYLDTTNHVLYNCPANGSNWSLIGIGNLQTNSKTTSGSGSPSGNCPDVTQYYVNTATGDFYDCPVSGSGWVMVGSSSSTNTMTTLGDVIYGGASGVPTRLPGPTGPNSVPQSLISTPSGGAATAPAWGLAGVPTNAQTGTSYTVLATDRASYVTFNNASAVAVTLPQAGSTGFANNFVFASCDLGAGTATITPTTSTISYTNGSAYTSGASSMPLTTGQCASIYSDNTNYSAILRSAGANVANAAQYSLAYYSASGSAKSLAGLAGGTTPNGVPQILISTPSGGVATAPTLALPGTAVRAVTGTTATDTIASTDCNPKRVQYTGSVAVAVTLPTASTLGVTNCVFKLTNNTTGSGTAVTITPTTWTIGGNATLILAQGQMAQIYVDPNGSNWDADVMEQGLTAGTGISFTRSATGLTVAATGTVTVASGTSALGTSAIASGACATVVTGTATGTLTTDAFEANFNADPTGVTGYAPSANGMLTIVKYPTANNVNFKVCNNTASSITPGAITLNWRVTR